MVWLGRLTPLVTFAHQVKMKASLHNVIMSQIVKVILYHALSVFVTLSMALIQHAKIVELFYKENKIT